MASNLDELVHHAGSTAANIGDPFLRPRSHTADFFAYMVSRGIAEGLIDSNRGPTPADVGQPKR